MVKGGVVMAKEGATLSAESDTGNLSSLCM